MIAFILDSRTGEHWQREVPFVEIKAKQVITPQIFILCYSVIISPGIPFSFCHPVRNDVSA